MKRCVTPINSPTDGPDFEPARLRASSDLLKDGIISVTSALEAPLLSSSMGDDFMHGADIDRALVTWLCLRTELHNVYIFYQFNDGGGTIKFRQ